MVKKLFKELSVAVSVVVILIAVAGCKSKAEPAKAQSDSPAVSAVAEQSTCPVMGGAIDKNVYVEYKGKKVYFCCSDCKPKFEKEPEKYVSKLPQFAK
jgi:YHS domain-containing protein